MLAMATIAVPPRNSMPPVRFAPGAAPTMERLFAAQPLESFAAGEVVVLEGDAAEHVFQLVEGVLRVCRSLVDGRRAITGFLLPGDMLGVSFKDRYLCTAEGVTAVKLRRIARGRLHQAVAQSPDLQRQLFGMMCDEISAAQDQMLLLGRKTAQERVASFLLSVARKIAADRGGAREIGLPMTRLDMADYLGLTIETVSRVMGRLKQEGIIGLPSPQRVVIRRPDALQSLAVEDEPDDDRAEQTFQVRRRAAWPN